jgi:hypothetical protein
MRRMALVVGVFSAVALGGAVAARADDFPTFGVTYGAPSSLSGFAKETIVVGKGETSAVLFQGQAGLGGGEIAMGAGCYLGRDRLTLLSASGLAVRTWGSPRGVEPGRTLVGGRLEWTAAFALSAHVGVLYPIGDGQSRSARVVWGVGIGLPILWRGPLLGPMTE